MFTYLENIKTHTPINLSIEELVDLIKENPLQNKIEYLRSLEYKSKEYKRVKELLPCIITSGKFNGLKEDTLQELNGLIFFDIDGGTDFDLNGTIMELNDTIPITLIYKSAGGSGLHFFVKVNDLTPYNYSAKQNLIKDYLNDQGFNVDNGAKGIARKAFVSYDPNVIYIPDNTFNVEEIGWENTQTNNYRVPHELIKVERKELAYMAPSYIISFKDLLTQIVFETQYTKEIEGLYTIDPIEWYRISYPRFIKDGTKHTTYTRIISALIWLNPTIDLQQTTSYIWYINNIAENKFEYNYLKKFVYNMFKKIKKEGPKLKTRIKRIHFNKNYEEIKLTPTQKMSIAAKENGKLRKQNTINKIKTEIKRLLDLNQYEYTQKIIAENTGLGLRTIKRYWKEVDNNLY